MQTLLERCNLHVYLEHEAELGLFKENKQLKEDYQRLKQTWKKKSGPKEIRILPSIKPIESSTLKDLELYQTNEWASSSSKEKKIS